MPGWFNKNSNQETYPMFKRFGVQAGTVVLSAIAVLAANSAIAQTPASKPLRIVVGFAPGGTTDILARLIGQKITEQTGQPVIVDNKPGAAGTLAARELAKAAPDGYTLGMLISSHVVSPHVMKKLPYDALADFTPITVVGLVPGLVTVTPSFPARTLAEALELARRSPGKFNYALPGTLTAGHVAMELLKERTGLAITPIPYRGGAPAIADVIGGQVEFMINSPASSGPYVTSGQLRPLATTGATRSTGYPNLPTVAEAGIKDFSVYEWYGVFGPARMPPAMIAKWNQEINKALKAPEVMERLKGFGAEPGPSTPEAFDKFVRSEYEKWGPIAKQLAVGLD
jgi:tripartite-type tricarboxylate transporter receptor subunit TctC